MNDYTRCSCTTHVNHLWDAGRCVCCGADKIAVVMADSILEAVRHD